MKIHAYGKLICDIKFNMFPQIYSQVIYYLNVSDDTLPGSWDFGSIVQI